MTDVAAAGAPHLSRRQRLGAALALGALFALGQAPADLWPLALAALVLFFVLIRFAQRPAEAGWTAWVFGAGYFGLSLHWIVEPFLVDAALTGWMAPFGLAGLAGGLALFWAVPAWLAWRIGRPALVVPLWALSEMARAYVLTGFPWGLVGYVWSPSPAAHWAAFVGSHGLTLAALTVAALGGHALARRDWRIGGGAIAGVVLMLGGGALLAPPPDDLDGRPVVRLVQPNAPQHLKWRRDMVPVYFERQVAATAAAPRPDLIVWPETALPMLLDNAGEALAIVEEAARGAPVVVGIQREEDGRWFNSAVTIGPQGGIVDVYDKHHLVPFGEYMPARWLFEHIEVSGLAARAEGGYSPGPGPRLLDLGALGAALPLICYEAVFPQDVTGAPARPEMLLQLTNDAWFGTFSGPYQHLAQARMRAIETGLPLLRAANTGVSAVIDSGGRVLAALPLGQAGHVDHPLPPAGPATLYSRTGDWPALVALLALLAGLALRAPLSSRIDAGPGRG
ncbi:Apolipoprotein N-acyltransferase [Roseivivax jejudonensis]|uniref:Apolipoprotein N-acyltransferase n=1 Tax=Roseivivax jejudonensis TaxID=1529041 RepID=A0A1X6Y8N9_9RHOB|nr:apolipoprotein N-acyltransferase [Roseivivax jejudonensis]SLN13674.1 Apolipoprotein N-acyltransferase [Roseivivax jejudonensis]